jgi:hypothetical protein
MALRQLEGGGLGGQLPSGRGLLGVTQMEHHPDDRSPRIDVESPWALAPRLREIHATDHATAGGHRIAGPGKHVWRRHRHRRRLTKHHAQHRLARSERRTPSPCTQEERAGSRAASGRHAPAVAWRGRDRSASCTDLAIVPPSRCPRPQGPGTGALAEYDYARPVRSRVGGPPR